MIELTNDQLKEINRAVTPINGCTRAPNWMQILSYLLFIDHISRLKRDMVMKKLAKMRR